LFLGLALLVELLWIYNLSAFFQSVYTLLEIPEKRLYLLRLATAANFLNIVAPSGGLSGLAVFISDARRRQRSTARVTIAGLLFVWFDYWSILLLLVLGLGDLQQRGALHWAETTAAGLLLSLALGVSLMLYLGMKSAQALGTLLARIVIALNWVTLPFIRRPFLKVEQAYDFANEVASGISILRYRSNWALLPFLYSIMNKLLQIIVLALCFLAFRVEVDLGVLVAGLSLGQLFLVISPTPSGLGIVEGVMTLALTTLGIRLSDAAVITLSYRAFSFWLPFLVGMISLRTLDKTQNSVQAAVPAIPPTEI
jgi:glycosyltransferase 2 family protein